MSFDLYLKRRDNKPLPFSESEIKNNLEDTFSYLHIFTNENKVSGFEVSNTSKEDSVDFAYQDESNEYWTYCSYAVSPEIFEDFLKTVRTVSIKLDFLITDPQSGEEMIDPKEFGNEKPKSEFKYGQEVTTKASEKLHYILPVSEKQFLTFLIFSQDNLSNFLLFNKGIYATDVKAGESIDQVVKKDLKSLIGDMKYNIFDIQQQDIITDKSGNKIPRFAVSIKVPHFDPESNGVDAKWVKI